MFVHVMKFRYRYQHLDADFDFNFENLHTDCSPLTVVSRATGSTEPNWRADMADDEKQSQNAKPESGQRNFDIGFENTVKRDRCRLGQAHHDDALANRVSKVPRLRATPDHAEAESEDETGDNSPVYTPSPASEVRSASVDPPSADTNHEAQLGELLELEADGLDVVWPPGWTSASAKARMRERPSVAEPASKVRAVQLPERTTICGSTPAVVQRRNVAPPLAVPKRLDPAPSAAPTFGSGHDLRRSGDLIWCRKCGRYGAERFREDGLGGPCRGREARNMTHWKRLMSGKHPTDKHRYLPPDVAFYR